MCVRTLRCNSLALDPITLNLVRNFTGARPWHVTTQVSNHQFPSSTNHSFTPRVLLSPFDLYQKGQCDKFVYGLVRTKCTTRRYYSKSMGWRSNNKRKIRGHSFPLLFFLLTVLDCSISVIDNMSIWITIYLYISRLFVCDLLIFVREC